MLWSLEDGVPPTGRCNAPIGRPEAYCLVVSVKKKTVREGLSFMGYGICGIGYGISDMGYRLEVRG